MTNQSAGLVLAKAGTVGLFEGVEEFLRRYVVFASDEQVTACVLYVAHTWVVEAAAVTPYLAVSSAERQSGKSRLLEVLEVLVRDPWPVVSPTPAVLYRVIEDRQPTLIWDEVDTVFNQRGQFEDLRAILNAGFRRGARVPRWNADRNTVDDFRVFCPKVLAGIGEFPDTVADRAIPIRLRRRIASEQIARLRESNRQSAVPVRDGLEQWAQYAVEALTGEEPTLPDELGDRAQDAWEPLLAIADLAGGQWPDRARTAALSLATARVDSEESFGTQLLRDIRTVFDNCPHTNIASATLADQLKAMDDSPWATYEYGRGLTAHSLRRLLEPYEIHTKTVRVGQSTPRGFQRAQFEDAWTRWLPLDETETSQHEATDHAPEMTWPF